MGEATSIALGALVLASGCNAIFGLDPTRVGDDGTVDAVPCPAMVNHDEDGDGVDDACDRCPSIADAEQTDADGDQVGDACDPEPDVEGDVILVFDSLTTPEAWTPIRGSWTATNDSLVQGDPEIPTALASATYAIGNEDVVTIDVVGSVTSYSPWNGVDNPAYRGLGIWFASKDFNLGYEPDGYSCQALLELAAGGCAIRLDVWNGDTPTVLAQQVFVTTFSPDETGRVRAGASAAGMQRCEAFFDTGIVTYLSSQDPLSPRGQIGLRTVRAAARIDSVTVYGRR